VNDQGQIVGYSFVGGGFHATLWDQDGPHDLGTLEGMGGSSYAYAISAEGLPVGLSSIGGEGEAHAVLWSSYGISNLGTLGGSYAWARAISGHLIVGTSSIPSPPPFTINHAFIYDNDGPGYPIDLNDLIPADAGWLLDLGTGINSAGLIIGYGEYSGEVHPFLLTPVPPTTTPR
jgi:probable HAF family extracellular repeat protein